MYLSSVPVTSNVTFPFSSRSSLFSILLASEIVSVDSFNISSTAYTSTLLIPDDGAVSVTLKLTVTVLLEYTFPSIGVIFLLPL